jgi:hypothetical protein
VRLFKIDKDQPKKIKSKNDMSKELEPYIPTTLDLEKDQNIELQKKLRRMNELKKNQKKPKKLTWVYEGF